MSQHLHWTPGVKAAFIDALAASGEVLAAVETVGLSPQSAYRHRALDPEFARAWDSARIIAREVVVEELRSRALHGWEENVYFRGELCGSKKRHDNRLLLALLARLDKLAGDEGDATAHRARDHFGRLIASLENGGATDHCYPLSAAEEIEEMGAEHHQRTRWRYYNRELEHIDREEEQEANFRRRLVEAELEDDEEDDDEDLHPLLRRPPRPTPESAADGDAVDDRGVDGCALAGRAEIDGVDPHPDVSAARGYHPVSPLPSGTPSTDAIPSPHDTPALASDILSVEDWPADDDWRYTDDRAGRLFGVHDISRPPGPSIRAL
jgi:hypothetical protein